MRKQISLLFSLLSFISFTAKAQLLKKVEGNNKYKKVEYRVRDFNKVNLLSDFNVIYQANPDSAGFISIYGEENIIELIEFASDKEELEIKFSTLRKPDFGVVLVRIYSSSLTEVHNQGSGVFEARSLVEAPQLNLIMAGNGQIRAKNTNSGVVKVSVGGSGDVVLGGKTGMGEYTVQGTGEVMAHEVKAEEVKAHITGSGTISCYATETIKTIMTGSGIIKCDGPAEIKSRTVGSGQIIRYEK